MTNKMNLYVISGVTGMTGNELARQLTGKGHKVIGFDNFFASSLHTVRDLEGNPLFVFHEYDLNSREQMDALKTEVPKLLSMVRGLVAELPPEPSSPPNLTDFE